MSEQSSRTRFRIATGVAFLFYILAIVFGLQSDLAFSVRALIYLAAAIVSTVAAIVFYRHYTRLRQIRWQEEMKAGEEKMRQLLTEEPDKANPETQNTNQ